MSVNRVTLLGRVGKDPEIKYTAGGTALANFSIATSKKWKDKQGQAQEKTEWHNITVWGNAAEKYVNPYVKKGSQIYIEGELQTNVWEDDAGKKQYKTVIVAQHLELTGSKGASGGDSKPQANQTDAEKYYGGGADASFAADDIPF